MRLEPRAPAARSLPEPPAPPPAQHVPGWQGWDGIRQRTGRRRAWSHEDRKDRRDDESAAVLATRAGAGKGGETVTATQMIPAVGQRVVVRCEDLRVSCVVQDVKTSYGQPRLLVVPVAGVGSQWVELGRVMLEGPQPGVPVVFQEARP